MSFLDNLEESFLVLRTNKMRTALSALGVIIGIASVIALMTLGEASNKSIKQRIQSLGSNLLTIRPGSSRNFSGGSFIRESSSSIQTLTESDALEIATTKRITTINSVAMEYSSRSQVSFARNNENVTINGVAGNYFKLRNLEIEKGSFFPTDQGVNIGKVAVLGPTTAENLFGTKDPIGQKINIGGYEFTVVGVTKTKGEGGFGSLDEAIYIPLLVAQKTLFGVSYLSAIYVEAKDEKTMDAAKNQIGFLLLELHKKNKVDDADFSINSQADILQTANEITGTFTSLLTGIAAISLVVGGIGIMNIMLVTVTERTSEIGLRKAIGAKNKTIISQFLTESVILTVLGGLLGIFTGVSVSSLIIKYMSLPQTVSVNSIILSFLVSSIIGIIFGLYPAIKASRLQPIEALRYE